MTLSSSAPAVADEAPSDAFREVIFEDDEIVVVHRPGGTGYTLVTFADLMARPDGIWIWADRPVRALGIEAIGFVAKERNWYPAASMRAAAAAVRARLRPRSIGYGYSMGGYGALKYAGLLGLTHALAVAPQVSIDPADVPQDLRFHSLFRPAKHAGMLVAAGEVAPFSVAVADPYWERDWLHVRHAARSGGAHELALPFVQHAAIHRFSSTTLLRDVLRLVLAEDVDGLRALMRAARARSKDAHALLGRAAVTYGHHALAGRLFDRAEALGAPRAGLDRLRAEGMRQGFGRLLMRRRRDAAIAIAPAVIEAQGNDIPALNALGGVMLRRGIPAAAALAHRRVLAVAPDNADAKAGLAAAEAAVEPAGTAPAPARPEHLLQAARGADWVGVLRIAAGLQAEAAGPGIVTSIVMAAAMLREAEAVTFAATFAASATLPPRQRAALAWRIGMAGFWPEALAIAYADPGLFGEAGEADPAARTQLVRILDKAHRDPKVPAPLRAAARAAWARLFDPAKVVARPAGIAFGPDGPRQTLPGPPPEVTLAPGAPAVFGADIARAMEKFTRDAATAGRPEVTVYENVFVNRDGLVWSREGRPVITYEQPVPAAALAAMGDAPSVPEGVLAVEPHGNIYHWFAEWLPALAWRLNGTGDGPPVLLSDRAPAFVAASLDLAEARPVPRIAVGDALFVERLYVATRALVRLVHGAAYGGLLARIGERAEMAAPVAEGPLYISRRDSRNRPMGNEAELEAALTARGFECLAFSTLPLVQQIARLRRAGLVVAPHGAGLSLLQAGRPDTRVLEILPALPGTLDLRCCFAKISRLAGHRHHLWVEATNPVTGAWRADLPGVLAQVDRMLGGAG